MSGLDGVAGNWFVMECQSMGVWAECIWKIRKSACTRVSLWAYLYVLTYTCVCILTYPCFCVYVIHTCMNMHTHEITFSEGVAWCIPCFQF